MIYYWKFVYFLGSSIIDRPVDLFVHLKRLFAKEALSLVGDTRGSAHVKPAKQDQRNKLRQAETLV